MVQQREEEFPERAFTEEPGGVPVLLIGSAIVGSVMFYFWYKKRQESEQPAAKRGMRLRHGRK